jgi:hypothetical protein
MEKELQQLTGMLTKILDKHNKLGTRGYVMLELYHDGSGMVEWSNGATQCMCGNNCWHEQKELLDFSSVGQLADWLVKETAKESSSGNN